MKHRKVLTITGSLIVIAVGIAAVFGAQSLLKTWKARFGTLHAKKTLVVSIDLNQQERFFQQVTSFADANAFDIRISATTPSHDTFSVYMSRKDILVWGANVFSPSVYDISFYDRDLVNPLPDEIIENLYEDLKRYINEIPNSIITEQRKSFIINIDESQREDLIAQLRTLAEEYSLEFTASSSTDKTLFHTEIRGEGFHVTSEPVVGSPKEISTVFFIDYHKAPTSASLERVDELSHELKSLLAEIPNVMISEEQ
jgi:hypothetical protein